MERKEIRYKGLTAVPSDYDCEDGELQVSMNLINEDGHLRGVRQPTMLLTLNEGEELLCVHRTADIAHYIVKTETSLVWIDAVVQTWQRRQISIIDRRVTIHKATAIGNIVVVLTDKGMWRMLWQGDEQAYLLFPVTLPELELSFGLQNKFADTGIFDIKFLGTVTTSEGVPSVITVKMLDESAETVTEAVMARINKLIKEEVTDKGRFAMPFFVRYGYRLYDESVVMQSAPILMMPTSDGAPVVMLNNIDASSTKIRGFFQGYAASCALDLQVPSVDLSAYKELIKSVDVFVSAPIYGYDSDGLCKDFRLTNYNDSWGTYKLQEIDSHYSQHEQDNLKQYARWNTIDAIRLQTRTNAIMELRLPKKKEGNVWDSINSTSNFYFVKSIGLDELSEYTTRKVLEFDNGRLNDVETKEAMADDYDSHDTLIADNAFVYNNRLHLSGIRKKLFAGYFLQPYEEHRYHSLHFTNILPNEDWQWGKAAVLDEYTNGFMSIVVAVYVRVKHNGRTITVGRRDYAVKIHPTGTYSIPYYYYPDGAAYEAVIYTRYDIAEPQSGYNKIVLPLSTHEYLNGAYWGDHSKWRGSVAVSEIDTEPSEDTTYSAPNKIYCSEVDNPFYFPVGGIASVGGGSVIGLSTAAQALSQGQFGQYPMYAFATDGVWAMSISKEGKLEPGQPLSRDICTHADSITQIDTAVLYATKRGVMLLGGEKAVCITDVIANDEVRTMLQVPGATMPTMVAFTEFLAGCRMVYDYRRQRIVLYNPQVDYAYVFSLRSKMWGMMSSDLTATVADWPDDKAVTKMGIVVAFGGDKGTQQPMMFLTRPLKLDYGDQQKTVRTVIQRGHFGRGGATIRLWGSRDLQRWVPVAYSQSERLRDVSGTGYKYYIIGSKVTLADGESISGATIETVLRHGSVTW